MTSGEAIAIAIMQKLRERLHRERNEQRRNRDILREIQDPLPVTLSIIASCTRAINRREREMEALDIGIGNTADYGGIVLDKPKKKD